MVKESKLTTIMLVQQLNDDYWLWDDKSAVQTAREKNNCQPLLKETIEHLKKHDIKVNEAYGIIHDKDKLISWNEAEKKNIEETKPKHVHFLFKFEQGASLKSLAVAAGVEPQYLEKLKSGRYGYDNCLAYLIHAKDENKYQSPPQEVVTEKGEDYESVYSRRIETWLKGRAKKNAQETNLSVDWLVSEILAGNITKNQILLTNEYYAIYGQHKRRINEALETAGERRSYRTIAELEAGKFKKVVVFIHAGSGMGKTVISKKLIAILQTISTQYNQKWESCVTASTNPFDEYNGQEILFLDDIRGDSLTVSDWLKLLDNYMISPLSARYHNKMGSAKVIIITSTKPPLKFFKGAKGNYGEDLGQFIRRISILLTIRQEEFCISVPEKIKEQDNNDETDDSEMYGSPHYCSYSFTTPQIFEKNKALDKIVKTVIKDMQWTKIKKVTSASDQTDTDNSTKQK